MATRSRDREATHRPGPGGEWLLALAGVGLLLAGCVGGGQPVDRVLQADRRGAAARQTQAAAHYLVACPDVLEIQVPGATRMNGRYPVGADGRIDFGAAGQLRVEGQPVAEIARGVAELCGVPASSVQVRVVEYNSQRVYLFGEVAGLQRTVPYQGEETIADLLHRAGGITSGAAPAHVHVIRPRIIEGKPPLVFKVDLEAIVMGRDQSTNIRVQPFDQIHVGETRRSSLEKCVPPLFRPLYQSLCGLEKPRVPAAPERGDRQVVSAPRLP
jgi:protein involved in polysaccharide export with SLBB domain